MLEAPVLILRSPRSGRLEGWPRPHRGAKLRPRRMAATSPWRQASPARLQRHGSRRRSQACPVCADLPAFRRAPHDEAVFLSERVAGEGRETLLILRMPHVSFPELPAPSAWREHSVLLLIKYADNAGIYGLLGEKRNSSVIWNCCRRQGQRGVRPARRGWNDPDFV
jgi:hypothetical protein